MRLGIDIGSTTIKLALIDEQGTLLYKRYERHMSDVTGKMREMLMEFERHFGGEFQVTMTGSGGLSLAKTLGIPFEQEVIACSAAVQELIPQTDVLIELGGEDAKITFYEGTVEQRMNGTCAGGTGAFIDQMALLLDTDASGLNDYAKKSTTIYPIAARCGVFAKTDIQPLINEGTPKEDLAASIFQAVVNQTISGLACGRVIRGNVAFLGGPLSFLSELRHRFTETLKLSPEQIVFPEDAQYYVAIGAAILAKKAEPASVFTLLRKMGNRTGEEEREAVLPPLFESEEERKEFQARHERSRVKRAELSTASGPAFLGIDAGSTTTKATLIDIEGNVLYTYYKGNNGNPVETGRQMLKELYSVMPEGLYIAKTVTTGYGEELMKTAFHADLGEIETVAHSTAAKAFLPEVDFILDIGGQDMKCIRIKDGAVSSIMLNEACSSGCGSFLETYARSVGMTVQEFAAQALLAEHPVDLGTRCTVFMNSRVKQAQKEGAPVSDIAAGLCNSVIRNALYKVIRLRDASEAGEHIVVQGGTFLNDAVLRSMERILDRHVIRPDIAGGMGAYGAALIGRDHWEEGQGTSHLLSLEELDQFTMETSHGRCGGCENRCQLTINRFADGGRFITGNRCERGAGKARSEETCAEDMNLFQFKYKRLFDYYQPLEEGEAYRGTIGIPRVLNMHEDYPFWFRFFTKLGFRVIVSPASNKQMYSQGMDTISSDTACYPAKLVHGHIKWLVDQGIKHIFYPAIVFEKKEDIQADNHYNCPVVGMYPEVISGNMRELFEENGVTFHHPSLPYHHDERLAVRLKEELSRFWKFRVMEIEEAVAAGRAETRAFRYAIEQKAKEILERVEREGGRAIVLAGRPYHLDPEINHGIDQVIASYGFAVLTESSVAKLSGELPKLRTLNQWMYHSRLYRAAQFCAQRDDVDLIQLNSFGCGLDAVTTDQVEELLEANNKLYTVLKIDEGSNLGAVRIRIRSLKAAIEERKRRNVKRQEAAPLAERAIYTEKMKEDRYTVLVPQMLPIHFDLISSAFHQSGYNVEILPQVDAAAIETGLKYIHNDACYPAIVVLGQILHALKSGRYDLNRVAVILPQTGGGCRASNYIALLRKAFKQLHWEHIPIISLNYLGMEKNPGFQISPKLLYSIGLSLIYGDLLMQLTNAVRPYELCPGSTQLLYEKWLEQARSNVLNRKRREFKENVRRMIGEFDHLPLVEGLKKPKVGVVGEILVKFHPDANNQIVKTIEAEGGEAVVPGVVDYFLFCMKNSEVNHQMMAGSRKARFVTRQIIELVYSIRKPVDNALRLSQRFHYASHIDEIAAMARPLISLGAQCGEGWMLVGEMRELMKEDVKNIVCLQPFGCLPNHIVGKGMMKPLRQLDPEANIVAIDYDPGASQVNQLNRIKLMMANASSRLETVSVPVQPAATGMKLRELAAAVASSAGAAAAQKVAAAASLVAAKANAVSQKASAVAVVMSTKTMGGNNDSTEVVAEAAVTVAEASAQLEYKEIRAKERAMEVKEEMEHYLDICYLKKCW
ncbi:MAG: 2-hydroxyacyl-CoA dehydratase [Firmicutes bacterium]|nr:2-hydroxyacyl-CoA dehydratase [Bacillota bacterium]